MASPKTQAKFQVWNTTKGNSIALNRDHIVSYYVANDTHWGTVLMVQISTGVLYDLEVKQLEALVEWTG